MNKDNLIKNIATKFQEARIRLRSNKPPNGYSTPRTPAPLASLSALSPSITQRSDGGEHRSISPVASVQLQLTAALRSSGGPE